jgi:hypothetical protein
MQIDEVMADLLIKIHPDIYSKHAYKNQGKIVMYIWLKKALNGTVTASLLFWMDLSSALTVDWGFEHSPYDWCDMNNMINGNNSQSCGMWMT